MNIQQSFQDALQILQLKEQAIHSVANDKSALRPALILLGVGVLATTLGLLIFPVQMGMITYRLDLFSLIGALLGAYLMQILGLALVGFLAQKFFSSKLTVEQFVKVMGHAGVINVLGVIPGLGALASLWTLVVLWKVLSSEGKMQLGSILILLFVLLVLFSWMSFYTFQGRMGMMF